MDAYITKKGSQTISGITWLTDTTPPYIVDYPQLSINPQTDRSYYLEWTNVISAEDYILQESDQRDFSNLTLNTSVNDINYLATKKADDDGTTYYYRVRGVSPDVDNPSRWSNVISVALPLQESNASTTMANPASILANGTITVQVRINGDEWQNATVTDTTWGAEWTYDWDLPEERNTEYTIESRATMNGSAFGPVDTITVTLDNKDFKIWFPLIFKRWPDIPYPPTLYDIDNPNQDNNYVVEWTYDHDTSQVPEPTSYTLQESQNASFPDDQTTEYTVDDGTSKEITDQESGTYYYRVRGHNEYGPGEWSRTKQVTVWGYFDDFSDHTSGWPREWSDSRGALYQVRPYEHPGCGPGKDCKYEDGDGYVIARRNNSDPFARFGPGVEIPSGNYEIEFKSRWFEAQYHATYQIFFDSNKNFDRFYSIKIMIYDPGNDNTCGYQVYGSNGSVNAFGEEIINELSSFNREKAIKCGVRNHNGDSTGDTGWNHWRIRREGNKIKIYVNGKHLGTWTASAKSHRYFGVGCTLYEGLTPSKPEFDNWSVKLLD
jgi:hypothetical protein